MWYQRVWMNVIFKLHFTTKHWTILSHFFGHSTRQFTDFHIDNSRIAKVGVMWSAERHIENQIFSMKIESDIKFMALLSVYMMVQKYPSSKIAIPVYNFVIFFVPNWNPKISLKTKLHIYIHYRHPKMYQRMLLKLQLETMWWWHVELNMCYSCYSLMALRIKSVYLAANSCWHWVN